MKKKYEVVKKTWCGKNMRWKIKYKEVEKKMRRWEKKIRWKRKIWGGGKENIHESSISKKKISGKFDFVSREAPWQLLKQVTFFLFRFNFSSLYWWLKHWNILSLVFSFSFTFKHVLYYKESLAIYFLLANIRNKIADRRLDKTYFEH